MEDPLEIEGTGEGGGRMREKLGILTDLGWSGVPNAFFMFQAKLGIKSEDAIVYLNAFIHWHDARRMPFPHAFTIAERMGRDVRTVQRALNRLKKRGFIRRIKSRVRGRPDRYDVRPLLKMLEPHVKMNTKPVGERSFDQLPGELLNELADEMAA